MKLIMARVFMSVGILSALLCSQHTLATISVIETVQREGQAGAAREGAQQKARRIWEHAIAAKGGRESLYAVQNLVISTVGSYTTGSGKANTVRTEAFFVFPNKAWSWVDLRPDVFGLTVEMFNFDSNTHYLITSDNSPPVRQTIPLTETSASQTHSLLAYLLETKWLQPELVNASTERIGRRTVDVVHTVLRNDVEGFTPENKYIDFTFDQETHLPIRVSYYHQRGDIKVLDVAENLSDYTEVRGIKVPQKSEVDGRVEKINIKINVLYNEDIFTKPPTVAAGPEQWKIVGERKRM